MKETLFLNLAKQRTIFAIRYDLLLYSSPGMSDIIFEKRNYDQKTISTIKFSLMHTILQAMERFSSEATPGDDKTDETLYDKKVKQFSLNSSSGYCHTNSLFCV